MSADIHEFKSRAPDEKPHVTGAAKCMDCKHEFVAVVEQEQYLEDIGWFECPTCLLEKARFKYPFRPSHKMIVWECKCGNDLFHIGPLGSLCPKCGRTGSP